MLRVQLLLHRTTVHLTARQPIGTAAIMIAHSVGAKYLLNAIRRHPDLREVLPLAAVRL